MLLQGEPGAAGVSGLPGLPGEDGAPGQKVNQCLTVPLNTDYENKSHWLLNNIFPSFRGSLVCLV